MGDLASICGLGSLGYLIIRARMLFRASNVGLGVFMLDLGLGLAF